MKQKIVSLLKNNAFSFILGAILFGGIGYVVATTIESASITYTTSSNNSVTNVDEALDDLCTRSNTWINPTLLEYASYSSSGIYTYWTATQG